MKQFKILLTGFLLIAAALLCTCQLAGDSSSDGAGGGGSETPPIHPGGVSKVTVEITGAITKSVTVPIIKTSYNNEYDLWVGDEPSFEVRFKWPGMPVANNSYNLGSGFDEKILVADGDKTWGTFISYTVTLTSIHPASGTITGKVKEDTDKAGPIDFSVTFSGI